MQSADLCGSSNYSNEMVNIFCIMSSFEDRGGEGFPVNGTHTGVSRS